MARMFGKKKSRKSRRTRRPPIRRRRMRTKGRSDRSLAPTLSPFQSYRTPKIPDGSVTESHGRQFKGSRLITAATDLTIDVLLCPGLGAGCVYKLTNTTQAGLYTAASEGVIFNTGHGTVTGTLGASATDALVQYTANDNIAKWRMVSSALRFTDLTADNSVKGYFESIIINRQLDETHIIMHDPNLASLTASAAFTGVAVPQIQNLVPSGTSLTNDPSYQTGSFKDLNNMVFHMKSADNHRSFCLPPKSTGATLNITSGSYGALVKANSSSPSGLSESMFDPCYCFTLIRLYMPAASRLLLEHVSNQELVYAESSTLNTFMTKSYSNPSYSAKRRLVDGVAPGNQVSKRSRNNT